MKDQDVQTKREIYSRLHNKVWSIDHEDWYRWFTYHLFVEEEYANRYYQDDTRIPTGSSS